jgi:isoleucyl-tRNA synthetase
MQGYTVRRVWGWDCHGLPIENLIEKELNLNSKKDIEEYGIGKFTNACSESVLRYDKEWKNIIPRMGRWVDMEHAYKTMDATYTESIWWAWKELWNKGLAYEGYKIMHICPRCETPLAQSEVGLEYHDITDMSVTAEFELLDFKYENNPIYVLAWTTTPWTLPGNTALAINRNIEYVLVESKFEEALKYFVVAKSKAEHVFAKSESYKIIKDIKAEELIGLKYKPVFNTFNNEEFLNKLENRENVWKIWHADFINDADFINSLSVDWDRISKSQSTLS